MSTIRRKLAIALLTLGPTLFQPTAGAQQVDIPNPAVSDSFGSLVNVLPNSKYAVVDPGVTTASGPGDPDTTFGAGGKVETLTGNTSSAESVAVQSDGKIVVAGESENKYTTLVRYNQDGSLDVSFGQSGIVKIDFAFDAPTVNAVRLQSDGKIVTSGGSEK